MKHYYIVIHVLLGNTKMHTKCMSLIFERPSRIFLFISKPESLFFDSIVFANSLIESSKLGGCTPAFPFTVCVIKFPSSSSAAVSSSRQRRNEGLLLIGSEPRSIIGDRSCSIERRGKKRLFQALLLDI